MEHNKELRGKLHDTKKRRDEYLERRIALLKPFLADKNYFQRKEKREEKKKEMEFKSSSLDHAYPVNQFPGANNVGSNAGGSVTFDGHNSSGNVNHLPENSEIIPDQMDVVQGSSQVIEASTESASFAATNHSASNPVESMDEVEEAPEEEDPDDHVDDDIITSNESQVQYALRGVTILKQPTILKAELHEHQFHGISWMVHMFQHGMPMILGDQMGLGKTIQTIGFLAYMQESMNIRGPHLVVVPLSVLSNWIAEIERFCPSFRAVRFHGPKDERMRIKEEELNDINEFDIVVTTFEMLVSEVNFFKRKYMWTTVIVDEGHRLKNEKSQLSEKLRSVPCLSRVILTGTPLQNNLRELWALLHFLSPEIFTQNSLARFEDGFDLVRGVIDSNLLRRARKLLCIFMLRRVKDQVNIVLPSRKEITMLVPLTSYQVEVYKQLLCGLDSDTIETVMRESSNHTNASSSAISREPSHQALTIDNDTKKNSKKSSKDTLNTMSVDTDWRKLMNLLLQLRKVCNHTYLLPDLMPDPYEIDEEIVNGSGKLKMLDRMLPRLKEDGHRVLIFSQFTSMLDILEDYCELREYSFVRLDGETNRVQRRLDVRRFNSPNSQLFIFLISTRAGGLGLNLASADTVILYDSDWNPQVDLQAMERAHRIGQTKPVRVYRLVCQGSIEERMVSRAEKKLFLNAMVAEADVDGDENDDINEVAAENDLANALGIGGATMSKGELASLIRFGANAVIESDKNDKSSGKEMPDSELDLMLERQGRDQVQIAPSSGMANDSSAGNAAVDPIELAQATLRDRLEILEEVDLRQLGNVIYKKKKVAKSREVTLDDLADSKRVRKMRIVMVDGKGTGYGGAVPILSDNMMQDNVVVETTKTTRGRIWNHQSFCSLCAKSKNINVPSTYRCAHCPLVFHLDCAESVGITRPSAMFICPHHKCSMCTRSTAAAGGMLFRCIGCLTSYCEDCLPQDEIDSVGKFRILKDLGYESKQSYYIKCPTCCTSDGDTAQGVLGDLASRVAPQIESEEGNNAPEDTVEPEPVELLATQAMRLQWVEEQDSEDEKKKSNRKRGRKGKGSRKRKNDDNDKNSDVSDGEEEEELANSKIDENIKVPSNIDASKALDMVLNHPYGRVFEDVATLASTNKKFQMLSVSAVRIKIQSGRYRSVAMFVADVRSCIEPITRMKGNMDKLAACSSVILNFFNNKIVPNLTQTMS